MRCLTYPGFINSSYTGGPTPHIANKSQVKLIARKIYSTTSKPRTWYAMTFAQGYCPLSQRRGIRQVKKSYMATQNNEGAWEMDESQVEKTSMKEQQFDCDPT